MSDQQIDLKCADVYECIGKLVVFFFFFLR